MSEPLLVPLSQIVPDPHQPRRSMDSRDLETLARSLAASGLVQPIVVTPLDSASEGSFPPEARYMILAGERRYRAAARAGLSTVPIALFAEPLNPARRLALQLVENDEDNRKAIPLADQVLAVARAYQLAENPALPQFAAMLGRSKGWASKHLKLANAGELCREALDANLFVDVEAAYQFLSLPTRHQARLKAQALRHEATISRLQVQAARPADPILASEAPDDETEEEEAEKVPSGPSLSARPTLRSLSRLLALDLPGDLREGVVDLRLPRSTAGALLQAAGLEPPASPSALQAAFVELLDRLSNPSTDDDSSVIA